MTSLILNASYLISQPTLITMSYLNPPHLLNQELKDCLSLTSARVFFLLHPPACPQRCPSSEFCVCRVLALCSFVLPHTQESLTNVSLCSICLNFIKAVTVYTVISYFHCFLYILLKYFAFPRFIYVACSCSSVNFTSYL